MPDKSEGGGPAKTPKAPVEAASQEKRATPWVLPVATAVVLIASFCLYYFVYVKAQREYLGNRNFRSLAALGDQLQLIGHALTQQAEDFINDRHLIGHKKGDVARVRPGRLVNRLDLG